jgi:hypothetical protein
MSKVNNEPSYYNFPVFLQIHSKNDKHALELRKLTTDTEAIKIIINCAITEKPIIVFPTFRDKFRALGTLATKGVIEYNKKKECFEFLI